MQPAIDFNISLGDNRYLRPAQNYELKLRIDFLSLSNVPVTVIRNIEFILDRSYFYKIEVNGCVPCEIPLSLVMPEKNSSWYPTLIVNGIDHYGYPQRIPFLYTRPIISTYLHPIYDARLGRSTWNSDEGKIFLIKNMLNAYGFDCSTIGREIQPPKMSGTDFIAFEKQWASEGHCFISVLTPRDRTSDGRLALPPPWVVNEAGLSYESDRPQLIFAERGTDLVAMYGYVDQLHIINFSIANHKVFLPNDIHEKLMQFRNECQKYGSDKKKQEVGKFIFVGLIAYGGFRFFSDLFNSK